MPRRAGWTVCLGVNTLAYTSLLVTLLWARPLLAAESVPFDICAESTIWTRPSSQMQARIWNDARYKDFARDAFAWTHNFLVIDDFQSVRVTVTLTNLSGLWTVKPLWLYKCYLDQQRQGFNWIEIWSLLHRVKEIQHDANRYTVIVEPSGKGFQWIFVPRLRLNQKAVLRFVTRDGKELETWDESAPPRQFSSAAPPGAIIRGPNGEIIRK
jgi:hypothetical protein